MLSGALDKVRAVVATSLEHAREAVAPASITLSRMTGARATTIGHRLVDRLNEDHPEPRLWTLFDKELVQKVLEDHQLPAALERFMPEDKIPVFEDVIGDVIGARPPELALVRKTEATIYRLIRMGHTIVVGRGAHIITAGYPYALHVRLVGSEDRRVSHYRKLHGLSQSEGLATVRKLDRARRRYVLAHFGKEVDDPTAYHLVLNTDLFDDETATELIAAAVRRMEETWNGAEVREALASRAG